MKVTGEFAAQRASNANNVSIWWRHHVHLGVDDVVWSDDIIWNGQRVAKNSRVTPAER